MAGAGDGAGDGGGDGGALGAGAACNSRANKSADMIFSQFVAHHDARRGIGQLQA